MTSDYPGTGSCTPAGARTRPGWFPQSSRSARAKRRRNRRGVPHKRRGGGWRRRWALGVVAPGENAPVAHRVGGLRACGHLRHATLSPATTAAWKREVVAPSPSCPVGSPPHACTVPSRIRASAKTLVVLLPPGRQPAALAPGDSPHSRRGLLLQGGANAELTGPVGTPGPHPRIGGASSAGAATTGATARRTRTVTKPSSPGRRKLRDMRSISFACSRPSAGTALAEHAQIGKGTPACPARTDLRNPTHRRDRRLRDQPDRKRSTP